MKLPTHARVHTCATHSHSCEEVKERWEQARVTIGSQWVWLEHKLAELNTQICQLDNTLQKRPTKESFTFVVSDVSPGLCYPTNGTLKVVGGAPANHKQQILPNGCSYVGHHPQLPHLLLPDGVLGSKLQVCVCVCVCRCVYVCVCTCRCVCSMCV